jgi:hypothetical protein
MQMVDDCAEGLEEYVAGIQLIRLVCIYIRCSFGSRKSCTEGALCSFPVS